MSFPQNHSSQGHLSNKGPVIDCGWGCTFSGVGGGQKYSLQSNGGSEINNSLSRGGRGIMHLFKAYEGFQNSVFIKKCFCPPPLPQNPNSVLILLDLNIQFSFLNQEQECLNFSAILFTIGNMVLVPEACYNNLLLSIYRDLPLDSIAAGQDIMVYKFMLSRCFCCKVNLKPSFAVSDIQVPPAKLLCRPLLISSTYGAFKIRIPDRHKLKEKMQENKDTINLRE